MVTTNSTVVGLPQTTMRRVDYLLDPHPNRVLTSPITPEEWRVIMERIVRSIGPFGTYFEGYVTLNALLFPKAAAAGCGGHSEFIKMMGQAVPNVNPYDFALQLIDLWPQTPLAIYWMKSEEGFRLLHGPFPRLSKPHEQFPEFVRHGITSLCGAIKNIDRELLPLLAHTLIALMEKSLRVKHTRLSSFAKVTGELSMLRDRIGLSFQDGP